MGITEEVERREMMYMMKSLIFVGLLGAATAMKGFTYSDPGKWKETLEHAKKSTEKREVTEARERKKHLEFAINSIEKRQEKLRNLQNLKRVDPEKLKVDYYA